MKHLFLSLAVCGLLSACSTVDGNFDNKGFRLPEEQQTQDFQNPPAGKSRIYAFRNNSKKGAFIRYFISGHYKFNENEPFANIDDTFFVLRSKPGAFNFVDIERLEPITLYSKTEVSATLDFVPEADQIYCLKSAITYGAWIGRPKFIPLSEKECKRAISAIKGKERRYQEQQKYKQQFQENIEKKAQKQQ